MTDAMRFHAGFAEASGAVSEFRLLNNSRPILVGTRTDDGLGYRQLSTLLDGSPGGPTPLCQHIREVIAQIQGMEQNLRATGQKAVLVIATDGESSDGDIVTAMKPLERLPVWVVIRLCTDEDRICDYWNNIDKKLELDLDILDDLSGEAEEIAAVNGWLTYGEPLHRMREFGVTIKEIDLLDEARLSGDQILTVIAMLMGGSPRDYPHPQVDWPGFLRAVKESTAREQMVYNPLRKRPTPWILTDSLGRFFGHSSVCEGCSIS